jgi:hypothetical protein
LISWMALHKAMLDQAPTCWQTNDLLSLKYFMTAVASMASWLFAVEYSVRTKEPEKDATMPKKDATMPEKDATMPEKMPEKDDKMPKKDETMSADTAKTSRKKRVTQKNRELDALLSTQMGTRSMGTRSKTQGR